MKKKFWFAALLVFALLLIDQCIKIYVKSNLVPGAPNPLLGNWFLIRYIENPGMAFGTTLGASGYAKIALSIFRLIAIGAIAVYIVREIKKGLKFPALIALSMVFAGATGNLIDSMFYDFIFPFDPCFPYNEMKGSGVIEKCQGIIPIEVRNHGFLYGNVVDMFHFQAYWPESMPWVGGKEVFPAIFNFADACITIGISLLILIHRKSIFSWSKKQESDNKA
ncbi:MAG: hypothetical protein RL110_341 [Bacteroidota bacterium]